MAYKRTTVAEWRAKIARVEDLWETAHGLVSKERNELKGQNVVLLEALKETLHALNVAWDYDGDVFGVSHNDAMDATSYAEAAIKEAIGTY
jgi:hypothetical protein